MKKRFTFAFLLVLLIALCACNPSHLPNDDHSGESQSGADTPAQSEELGEESQSDDPPASNEYELTVIDYWGYLTEPLRDSYVAGEAVEVHLAFLSGISVGINLNGAYMDDAAYDSGYPVITFTMPAEDSVLYTTQNENIGFHSTFSRAGSGINPDIWAGALNADKLDDSPWIMPIYRFDTLSDLEAFKRNFGGENGFNYGWDEVPSLNEATEIYDEAFFDGYTLMLVCVGSGSGSYRFGFKGITLRDQYFCIHVRQTNYPDCFTDDVAAWFITVVVPDSMLEGCTEFDAELEAYDGLAPVPDDFSFALTWNVFGVSSYDSETGKLVKTTDATNPEDYVTYCQLTDLDMKYIYNLILFLDIYSYPDIYDPECGLSDPDATLILTVRVDDEEKTIRAEHISLFYVSENEKGQLFLDICNRISDMLESTDEWLALPDYENVYE